MNWQLKQVKTSDLKEYPQNPRVLTKKGLSDLKKSITKFGLAEPLVCNTDLTICGGHGRLKVLQDLKIDEVDCYTPDRQLTDIEFKELNIRLNKNIAGEFDFDVLANFFELDNLKEWGFKEDELDMSLFIDNDKLDEVPEVKQEAISQTGDLFLLDNRHRVLCGDSTKKEDVDKLMNGQKAEILFTSPPYLDLRQYGGDCLEIKHLNKFIETFYHCVNYQVINLGLIHRDNEIKEYWGEYIQKAKKIGYKFLSWNVWNRMQCGSIGQQTAMFGTEHEWIFVFGKEKKKLNRTVEHAKSSANRRLYKPSTQRVGDDLVKKKHWGKFHNKKQLGSVLSLYPLLSRNNNYDHPAMFPIELPTEYILALTNTNQIVLDPFLGSGTTLIASEQTNRICYGMEINPIYIDVILKRYHNLFPNKEVKCLNRNFDFKKLFS